MVCRKEGHLRQSNPSRRSDFFTQENTQQGGTSNGRIAEKNFINESGLDNFSGGGGRLHVKQSIRVIATRKVEARMRTKRPMTQKLKNGPVLRTKILSWLGRGSAYLTE